MAAMFESLGDRRRPSWKSRVAVAVLCLSVVWGLVWLLRITHMPLSSYKGPLPSLSNEQSELADRLVAQVKYLSATVGERSMPRGESLNLTVDYLRSNLIAAG